MDLDILLPIIWTLIFSSVIFFSFRRLSRKAPTNKKWVRPEKIVQKDIEDLGPEK